MEKDLEVFEDKAVCPRCDGNGLIYKAKILDLNTQLYICDECDACWKEYNEIDIKTFLDLQTFLERYSSVYSSSNIINLGYNWLEQH